MFTWVGAIKALSELFNKVLDYVDEYRNKQEAKQAQKESDSLHDSPSTWFKQHFRMRSKESKTTGSNKASN